MGDNKHQTPYCTDLYGAAARRCLATSHSAYVATDTESNGAKIDGF